MTGRSSAVQQNTSIQPRPAAIADNSAQKAVKAAAPSAADTSVKNASEYFTCRVAKQSLAKMQLYRPSPLPSASAAQAAPAVADGASPGNATGMRDVSGSRRPPQLQPSTGCKTCQERTYQDGSNDSGVSFQTPRHISSATAGIAVASHEGEHVSRETDKAQREGRIVTEKTVTFQMACCPECHKMYIAGGTTKISTMPQGGAADVTSALAAGGASGDTIDLLL